MFMKFVCQVRWLILSSMRNKNYYLLLTFIVATVSILLICPQTDSLIAKSNDESGPKVGIVLSGGGAKGLSHIALLRILEEVNMPIDFIGGTSMGSIISALYAIGYTSTEIEEIVSA